MTKQELLAMVEIHLRNGTPFLVALSSIPQPWRDDFAKDLFGSACPIDEKLGSCAYAWDWISWVNGTWIGRQVRGLE